MSVLFKKLLDTLTKKGVLQAVGTTYIFEIDDESSLKRIKARDTIVETGRDSIGNSLAGIARVYKSLEKMKKITHYTKVFSTRSSVIKRSDHLEFCWTLALHEFYEFHEKWTNYNNELKGLYRNFDRFDSKSVTMRVNSTKKIVQKYIKERGEKVHNWDMPRHELMILQMAEDFGAFGVIPHLSRDNEIGDFYMDARDDIIKIINAVHNQLVDIVDTSLLKDWGQFILISDEFMKRISELKEFAHSVTEEARSFQRGAIWSIDAEKQWGG